MAKTAKLKSAASKAHAANPRSRASKRATSPSINLDKSLKDAPRVEDAVLAPRPNAGISKKKSGKRGNARSTRQKVRQEKGLQRAEAVMDQLEIKKTKAGGREGKRRERRKVWEEVNGVAKKEKVEGKEGMVVIGGQWEDVDDGSVGENEMPDGDEEMEGVPEDGAVATTSSGIAGETLTIVDLNAADLENGHGKRNGTEEDVEDEIT